MEIQNGQLLKEIASHFFDKSWYIQTIDFCSKALEYTPEDAEIYDLRGLAYFRIMNIEKAIEDIEYAILKEPELEDAYSHLGDIYSKKHEYEKAEYYQSKAIELNDHSIFYKKQLLYTKYKLQKFDDALKCCNEILAYEYDNIWTLRIQISIFISVAKYQDALDQCLKFPKYLYKPDEWHRQVGYIYGKLGNGKSSIEHLDIALKHDSKNAYCLNNLGYAYYLIKQYSIALDLINESLIQDASNSYAYKNRAIVLLAMGEKSAAEKDLQMAQFLCYSSFYGSEVDTLLENIKI